MTGGLDTFQSQVAVCHATKDGLVIGVYRITCAVTGKSYIGSSTNVRSRLSWHKSHLRNGKHSREEMQKDFIEHGEAAFSFEILATHSTEAEALRAEAALIGNGFKAGNSYNSVVPIDLRGSWSRKPRNPRKKPVRTGPNVAAAWKLCEEMLEWRNEKEFVALIEQFLIASGMSVSAFGYAICSNHRFLPEIRNGRGCTLRRAEQIDQFIENKIAEYKTSVPNETAA